jgi:hypothetical protein
LTVLPYLRTFFALSFALLIAATTVIWPTTTAGASAATPAAIVPGNARAAIFQPFGKKDNGKVSAEQSLALTIQTHLLSEGYKDTTIYTAGVEPFLKMAGASVIFIIAHGIDPKYDQAPDVQNYFPKQPVLDVDHTQFRNGKPNFPAARDYYIKLIKQYGKEAPDWIFRYGGDVYLTAAGIAHFFSETRTHTHIALVDMESCDSMGFASSFSATAFFGFHDEAKCPTAIPDTTLLWKRLGGYEGVPRRTTSGAFAVKTGFGLNDGFDLFPHNGVPVVLSPAVTGVSPSDRAGLTGTSTPGVVAFDAKMNKSHPALVVTAPKGNACGASITNAKWNKDGTALNFAIKTPANNTSSGSVTLTVHNAIAQGAPGGSDNDKLDGNQNQGKSGLEPNRNDYTWKVSCGSSGFHLSGNVTTTLSLDSTATCNNGFTPRDVMLFMTPTGHPYTPVAQSGTTTFPTSSGAASLGYFPNGSVPDAYDWGDLVPGQADTTGTVTLKGNGSSGSVDLTVPALVEFGKQGQATTSETIVGSWDCNKK